MPPPPTAFARSETPDDPIGRASLAVSHRSIPIPAGGSAWRKLAAFSGPGYLVAVGYIDPGNWATGLAGGSAFGYELLWVVLLSNVMAMVLQALAARLGIVTGLDLAQACRARYGPFARIMLWLLCELAIIACDLAEVIGSAIALQLLFGLPLPWGVCATALDVFLVLALQRRGFRKLEAFIIALMVVIALCFAVEIVAAQPSLAGVAGGLVPSPRMLGDPGRLYLAMGILGATVMPHNLYLHSSIVQTRRFERTPEGKRQAIRFATIDSTAALAFALIINGAILVLAAATFHQAGRSDVAEIQDAYRLLTPMLGVGAASTLFAIALLAAGQNSTITGTLAGQIVMEGFTNLRLPPWARQLVSRLFAIVPAVLVASLYGSAATAKLLLLSQVVLSLQLPFAVIPLVRLTSDKAGMGAFANGRWLNIAAWTIAALLVGFNAKLIFDLF